MTHRLEAGDLDAALADPAWTEATELRLTKLYNADCPRLLEALPPALVRLEVGYGLWDPGAELLFALPERVTLVSRHSKVSPWVAGRAPARFELPTWWTPPWEDRLEDRGSECFRLHRDWLEDLLVPWLGLACALLAVLFEEAGREEEALALRALGARGAGAHAEVSASLDAQDRDARIMAILGAGPTGREPLVAWVDALADWLDPFYACRGPGSATVASSLLGRAVRSIQERWDRGAYEVLHVLPWLAALAREHDDSAADAQRWDGQLAEQLLQQLHTVTQR